MGCVWGKICQNSRNRFIWRQKQVVIYITVCEWTMYITKEGEAKAKELMEKYNVADW